MSKKIATEEERRARRKESARKSREKYREERRREAREYYWNKKAGLPRKPRAEKAIRNNREACRKYYANNKEKCMQWSAQWKDSLKARANAGDMQAMAQYLMSSVSGRAKRTGIEFSLVPEDLHIPPDLLCPVFGIRMQIATKQSNNPHSPSVDRIDPSMGYVKGNVQVISMLANRMKNNATKDQLHAFAIWALSQ